MTALLPSRLAEPARAFRRVLTLLWQTSPGWTVVASLLMLLEIGFGLAVLYIIKQLVDVITVSLQAGGEADIERVLTWVVSAGACTVGFLVSRSLAALAREAQGLRVAERIDGMIHDGALRADLAFFESPQYFDTLKRARQSGNQRPAHVVGNVLQLSKNGVMLAAVVALMFTIHPLLVVLVAIATLPALAVRVHFTRSLYQWQRERTQLERRAAYLDRVMTSDAHAGELRLNRIGRLLRDWYRQIRGRIRGEHLHILRRRTLLELCVGIVTTVLFFLALAWLARETAAGNNSVGELVLFLMVFQRAQAVGQEMVRQLSAFQEDHLYLGQLFEFLDVRPRITSPENPRPLPDPVQQGLVFEGVSFTYPGMDGEVLHSIDLAVAPGRVMALVGANGSGKTSLIKLMCRLYDPSAGRITLDGIDVRKFDLSAYRRLFSVIFQDYARYAMTVRDNIRFGDIREPVDSPRIEQAAEAAGADTFIRELERGYDTPLSRMFDGGQELSLGQWQRIALARALMHDSSFIILDEPTSALDPEAEFQLFENFRDRIGHRGAILISHRLSTIRMADEICVLEEGRITERGSHDELVRAGAVYAGMFERQGRFYRGTNDG